jgi:hypothetical protein
MLLDQAKKISSRIAQFRESKERAVYAQTFETRAGQLGRSAGNLKKAVAAMTALKENGIQVAFRFSANDQLRSKTVELKNGFSNNPAFVDDPGFNIQFEYLNPLSGLADSIKGTSLKAWQAHVDARRENVSSEILNALLAVPEYRAIVNSVRRCQQDIDRLAASIPDDVNLAEVELNKLANDQRKAWQQLTGGTLPTGVVVFLRASMGEGAELHLLTPEVIEWLQSRSLVGAFRIKPRSTL